MSVQNNIESNGVSPRTVPDTSSGNIITASDSEQNHRQIPLHWIFAFDSENSPVLPFNVRRSGSLFSVFSDGHEYVFSSFEEATRHAETNFKACPLSGRPVPTGPQNIGQLCRYLKNSYPEVFKDLSSHGKINKLYVFDDGYYLNNRALHPEMVCKNGIKCHGINGGCSFNHDGMPWFEAPGFFWLTWGANLLFATLSAPRRLSNAMISADQGPCSVISRSHANEFLLSLFSLATTPSPRVPNVNLKKLKQSATQLPIPSNKNADPDAPKSARQE